MKKSIADLKDILERAMKEQIGSEAIRLPREPLFKAQVELELAGIPKSPDIDLHEAKVISNVLNKWLVEDSHLDKLYVEVSKKDVDALLRQIGSH